MVVEPGTCRIAKTTLTSTLNRYGADFEVLMSGDVTLCFEDPLPYNDDGESKCSRFLVADLLGHAPV